MAERDKDNTEFKARKLKVFVKKIFFGPIELNSCSNVTFEWDDNPTVSGKLKFQALHEERETGYTITFEMFESCFGFISTKSDQERHTLCIKFREPCQSLLIKKCPIIQEKMRQCALKNSSPAFHYLTIILDEVPTGNVHNAIAEDDKNKLLVVSDLRNYMIQNLKTKFEDDARERYFKIRKRKPTFDYCFYDVINVDGWAQYLKRVGISISKFTSTPPSYEGAMMFNFSTFSTQGQYSTPVHSSENVARDKSNEFRPGMKALKKQGSQHPQYHDYGRQMLHGLHGHLGQQQPLNLPFSSLALDHNPPLQQHKIPTKRSRSKMEREMTPSPGSHQIERDGEVEEEQVDDEDDEMYMDEDDDEEEEEEEVMGEVLNQVDQEKESASQIVDLESDEEVPMPDPADRAARMPQPTDTIMKYETITLHFDDMKGLFYDEMVNDTIVDFYLTMVKKEKMKSPMREKTHVFSCFFYKRLTDGMGTRIVGGRTVSYAAGLHGARRFATIENNYKAISKWTRSVDLFEKDYVVIPVVDDLHWHLIIVIKPYKCIVPTSKVKIDNSTARSKGYEGNKSATYAVIFDSLYDAGDTKRKITIDIIRDYLELEYKHKKGGAKDGMVFDRSRIGVLRPKKLPQQSNFLDCGFFVMKYAEEFLKKPPAENMLRKGVYWKDWYVGFEIAVRYMRELVARTIEKNTEKKVWREYKSFERSRRDKWDPVRKQKESLFVAKCRRYPSEEHRSKGVKIARSHSEPPTLAVPIPSHFH